MVRPSVNDCDYEGVTPLCRAVRYNDIAWASRLIMAGANVNLRSTDVWTKLKQPRRAKCRIAPLFIAIERNNLEMMTMLLSAGAIQRSNNFTAIFKAAIRGNLEMMSVLIDFGADLNGVEPESYSLLSNVASYDQVDAVVFMIERGWADASAAAAPCSLPKVTWKAASAIASSQTSCAAPSRRTASTSTRSGPQAVDSGRTSPRS